MEPGVDVALRDRAAPIGRRRLARGERFDLLQAGVAAHRQRAPANDLHAVVAARIMRRGDLDAALVPVLADREVQHLGADLAQPDDIRTLVGRAFGDRPGEIG